MLIPTSPSHPPTPLRVSFHDSAFKACSFKNNSYHTPRASDIQAKGLRKYLQENTQGLWACPKRIESHIQVLATLTRAEQICMFLPTAHFHLLPFPRHGVRSYLEGILLGKVQNHVPPLPRCVGGIKHLGRVPTR